MISPAEFLALIENLELSNPEQQEAAVNVLNKLTESKVTETVEVTEEEATTVSIFSSQTTESCKRILNISLFSRSLRNVTHFSLNILNFCINFQLEWINTIIYALAIF